jgi:hypothetical protein
VGNTRKKITMERLDQDHLDVHEFHRKGLLRDREIVISPLLGRPGVVQIRVSVTDSWWSKLVNFCNRSRYIGRIVISADFALGLGATAGGASRNCIRALEAITADNASIIRHMPAKPKARRTELVLLPAS